MNREDVVERRTRPIEAASDNYYSNDLLVKYTRRLVAHTVKAKDLVRRPGYPSPYP